MRRRKREYVLKPTLACCHVVLIDDARFLESGDFPSVDGLAREVRGAQPERSVAVEDTIRVARPAHLA